MNLFLVKIYIMKNLNNATTQQRNNATTQQRNNATMNTLFLVFKNSKFLF